MDCTKLSSKETVDSLKSLKYTTWKIRALFIIQVMNEAMLQAIFHCVINVSFPLSGEPRTLQDLCRIKIRHCIGLQSLKFLEDLPIAKVMKDYLKHKFDSVWRAMTIEEERVTKKNSLLSFKKTMQSLWSLSGRKVHGSVLYTLKDS